MSALPKAVQAIGDAAEQQAVELGIKPGSKPATPAEPAQTVQQTQQSMKVDPDDWETRYKRYKSATDDTINDLRKQVSELTSTMTQVQQQNSDMMQKLAAASATPAPAPAATQQMTASQNDDEAAYKQWYDKLPQRFKDDYTDDYLRDQFFFQNTSSGQQIAAPPDNLKELEAKVDKVYQTQEKTAQQLYEEALDKKYPNDGWIMATKEPEWGAFCAKTVSPVDTRTYGAIVKAGNESHDVTSVLWVLGQYQQYKTDLEAENKQTQVVDPRQELLTPEGSAGGNAIDEINANADTFTVTQVQQFYQDRTKGKYSDEEFKAIEQSILRAQAAGKIIQG